MTNNSNVETRKVHPQKFALWLGIGSIIMMFAGFTSAFIVNKSSAQENWISFQLPWAFYVSTVVILLSSVTMHLAVKTFKSQSKVAHKRYVLISVLLGVVFAALQVVGFYDLFAKMKWQNNTSLHYIVAIVSVHAVHLLGGVIILLIMYFRTFSRRFKSFSATGIELIATYWHFVDVLWIYLIVFFLLGL